MDWDFDDGEGHASTRRRRADRARRRARERGRDPGYSLIELVVTIAIVAIILVPVMNAVIQGIRTSSNQSDLEKVETVLQNAADRVNRAPKVCNYAIYAQAAAQSSGWLPSQATVVQSRYVPGATPTVTGSWISGACAGSSPTDLLVQRVTITVTSPGGKVTRTIEVVKSDV